MHQASTWDSMFPELVRVAEPSVSRLVRQSRMVEISLSGSSEGLGRETGWGYSTQFCQFSPILNSFFRVFSMLAQDRIRGTIPRIVTEPPSKTGRELYYGYLPPNIPLSAMGRFAPPRR